MSRVAKKLPRLSELIKLFRVNDTQNGLINLQSGADLRDKQSVLINGEMFNQANVIYALHNGQFCEMIKYVDGNRCNLHVDNLVNMNDYKEEYSEFIEDLLL